MGADNDPRRGHRRRLRERFLKGGLDGFHDYEILELLLTLATPRRDCKATARLLLRRFGSLRAVLDASPEELRQVPGVGEINVFGLRLPRALAGRYLEEQARAGAGFGRTGSPHEVVEYLRQEFGSLPRERFVVLYLDSSNRVKEREVLFEGTIDQAAVYPREVAAAALRQGAGRLVLVHNHPGGSLRPSRDDLALTEKLTAACRLLDIEVLDHLIVTECGYYSMKEHGEIGG